MLTKEQILEKHYKNYQKRIAFEDQVLAAMEEYSQQQVKNCIKPVVSVAKRTYCGYSGTCINKETAHLCTKTLGKCEDQTTM